MAKTKVKSATVQPAQPAPPTMGASFIKALMDPDVPVPDNVVGPSGKKDLKRFSVYRNNVVVSLVEALADGYPAVKAILGEDQFARIARNYVYFHPPNSPMMQDFGSEFALFAEQFPPLEDVPFLVDVAHAERAWLEAFHAPDEPVLDAHDLSEIDPAQLDDISLKPRRATYLVCSNWPVGDLFAYRDGQPDEAPDLDEPQNLIITRPTLYVEARLLDDQTAIFLDSLLNGQTLGQAAQRVLAQEADADIASMIALLFSAGAFCEANLPAPSPTTNIP